MTYQRPSPFQYDAILVLSFGGPEGMDEVLPFLENVLRGRNVPHERRLAVARHYELFDGVSPINQANRKLIEALKLELEANRLSLPIYWGNRNWHPLLPDTMQQMADDGVRRALAFVTSAYSSYSSCRQYLENIAAARATVGEHAPIVDKIRAFNNHPLFVEANADHVREAFAKLPCTNPDATWLLFTAHSIPVSMAENCEYKSQLLETAKDVASSLGQPQWKLVFQSRSGPPAIPWLVPDICDALRDLKQAGAAAVVIAPIGFVSDHMEVIYDLDTEARRVSDELGIEMVRATTASTHPAFIKMIRELIVERINGTVERDVAIKCGSGPCCQPGHNSTSGDPSLTRS